MPSASCSSLLWYLAAGWWPVHCRLLERGAEVATWSRDARPRGKAEQEGAKVRFEFGPDALQRSEEVAKLVREMAGKVELRGRSDAMPLFDRLEKANGSAG